MDYVINDQNHVIKGIDRGETASFLGIRFARGERFKKPVLEPLAKEVDATRRGDGCPQFRQFFDESKSKSKQDIFYYDEFRKGMTFRHSEDCLNLNVYAPKNAQNLPVLLYIHGGAFVICSSDERPFDGTEIAKEGVICVTANYRLNVFGYNADEGAQNLAFYDMICAIEWIKANISVFGGDPSSITLMGQSAGAMSIQTLICSDMLKGKVKGAVMLSGGGKRGAILPISKPNVAYWNKLVKASGAQSFAEFKNLDAKTVWTTWKTKFPLGKALCTKPVIDGELVKDKRYDTDIPIVLGTVKKDLLPPVLNHMARAFARGQKKKNAPCYVFSLPHLLPPDDASFHSCDLWYVLGSLGKSPRPFTKADCELSDEIVDRMAEFARSQNPNIKGKEDWKTYSSKKDIKVFE